MAKYSIRVTSSTHRSRRASAAARTAASRPQSAVQAWRSRSALGRSMAYVASALSFMLENLAKPVAITGSQIPFCEVYNDARRNLIVSMIFASREDFLEVAIYFHDRLIRGNRASKINSFRVDAFDSPNFPRLAEVS